MGNCIDVLSCPPEEKARVLILNGGEKEFKASTPVKKITSGAYRGYKLVHPAQPYSPLPQNAKLKPGELYYLLPHSAQPFGHFPSPKVSAQKTCKRQVVRIVLTRQQLELLLKNTKKFDAERISFQVSKNVKQRNWKWQPSLAAIQE